MGPDLRPIMGATVGPNVAVTNFIASEIVRKVADEASVGNDCKSTEELLFSLEQYNKSRFEKGASNRKVVLASMDIDKWFPNMKLKPMTTEIKEMIERSGIEFKEIEYDAASKFLGERMTIEEIIEENMEDLLYVEETKLKEIRKTKNKNEGDSPSDSASTNPNGEESTNDNINNDEEEKKNKSEKNEIDEAHKECANFEKNVSHYDC